MSTVSDEDLYRQQVRESVERVNRATDGLHPVCDVGGSIDGCIEASGALVDATRTAVDDLESLDTPSNWTGEHQDLIRSLVNMGKAMDRRSAALRANDDPGWDQAQTQLASADEDFRQAVTEILGS